MSRNSDRTLTSFSFAPYGTPTDFRSGRSPTLQTMLKFCITTLTELWQVFLSRLTALLPIFGRAGARPSQRRNNFASQLWQNSDKFFFRALRRSYLFSVGQEPDPPDDAEILHHNSDRTL